MLTWAHYFFPHHMRIETPEFHAQMVKICQSSDRVAIAAPRESSKSTLLTFLDNFHDIMFKKTRFLVIVSNTFKKAAMSLDTIKKELTDNQLLKEHFPGIEITRDAEGDSIIRHPDGFETQVLCKGVEQIGSIRGVKFGAYRPDKINIDDVEDDELVRNPMRRQELQDNFDEALVPAGEKGVVRITAVGTILHDDALIAKLVSKDHYPEYSKLFYEALIDEGTPNERSLWPERWSVAWLHDLRKKKPTVFAKEYQNNPVAGLMGWVEKSDFRRWRVERGKYVLFGPESEIKATGDLINCKPAIALDLAWDEKRSSDYTVILPCFLTPESDILVDDYIREKGLKPNKVGEYLFVMESRLRALTGCSVPIGLEKGKLEKVTKWIMKHMMKKRAHPLIFKDLLWENDKNTRIVTRLEPFYKQHMIYHKQGMGDLEHELLRIPSGTHDDIADALQGIVQILKFPKQKKEPVVEDDIFMRVRQHALDAKKKASGMHTINGRRVIRRRLPAQIDILH